MKTSRLPTGGAEVGDRPDVGGEEQRLADPPDDHEHRTEARPAHASTLVRPPAHDQRERERDEGGGRRPAQDQDRETPAAVDVPGPDDRERSEHRGEEKEPEAEREREANPERSRLGCLVDLVEGADRRANDPRHLPDREHGRDHEQAGGRGREDAVHGLVDPVEDVGKHLRLDGRADRLAPELLLVQRAEEAEREQCARDGRDEHAQRDRAGVRQQAVSVEQVDPEPDDSLEAAPTGLHGACNVPEPGNSKRPGASAASLRGLAGRTASRRTPGCSAVP
jgi:hypothetical protein